MSRSTSATSYPWFGQNVLTVDQWSHVAVTFNGTQAELFINGHRVADPQNFTMNGKTDATMVFGASGAGPDDPYKGVLDDIRIYNYVLTPMEIGTMASEGPRQAGLPGQSSVRLQPGLLCQPPRPGHLAVQLDAV